MPTISIFFGIVIKMYWRDHPPAHFHAYYQGSEALFDIESGQVLAGDLPPGARRIVQEWAHRHRVELLENWERAKLLQSMRGIVGADEE